MESARKHGQDEVMRLLPAPLLSAILLLIWLMLVGSLSAGQIVLSAVLAIGIPHLCERLLPERMRIGNWSTVARFAPIVLYDIVASAITVARQILGPEDRIRPGFVWVPLTIRDSYGVTSLAGIITMTPGTLSVDISPDRRHLLVHAFHVDDPAALVATLKHRYELPLIAIFEGEERR
jgi:multicomponent K+:H+ antiporter subunit E